MMIPVSHKLLYINHELQTITKYGNAFADDNVALLFETYTKVMDSSQEQERFQQNLH